MCSDFCHQYGSYRPRLIHSQPSGEALWENVAGLLLFGWLVLVKNQPGDEDMEDQRWNAAERKNNRELGEISAWCLSASQPVVWRPEWAKTKTE